MSNMKISKNEKVKQQIDSKNSEEISVLKNQLARALADYDNLRKRTEEEKMIWIKFATQKFIQDLLPVLDNFESAQVHLQDSGLAIAINQFKEVLKNEGLIEIRPNVGENFDENLQEVVEVVSGKSAGKISELLVPGWKFVEGMVIRYAKVKVTKA